MAVASASKEKIEPSQSMESFPSSPLASKPASDAGSETSSIEISGNGDPSDRDDQSNSSANHHKDVEIQSPAYLKSEEYRLLFHLPPEEVLIQDFNCAFQESFLLQGHMYLFIHHICFYSNIFGFETKKTIPFHEVTCVRKAKTAAIFPNAIEIVAGGKKHFFASFLSRDEAYRLIVDGWSQQNNGAKSIIDQQESKSELRSQDNGLVIFEKSKSSTRTVVELNSVDGNKDTHIPEECQLESNGEDDIRVSTTLSEARENGEEDAEAVVNAECSSPGKPLTWKLEDADSPKIPEYYTRVAESKYPIKVEEFFNLFFSDDAANFIEMFHRKCGDKDFRCTSWYQHEQFGHARDVSFQHPIKIYFGAKFGNCQEVQKFRVYRNSHLVIETSQEINDVPYGDYFRVEGLWDVEQDGDEANKCCILRVYVNVAFSKKTMWRGKIEQSTVEECREAYMLWIKNACELLEQRNLGKLEGESPAVSTIQHDDFQFERHAKTEGPSERFHETRNLTRISQLASDSSDVNQQVGNPSQRDFSVSNSTKFLFRESWVTFCSYMKSQSHLPLVLAITLVVILLLMQLSIVLLLTRAPQVHIISQTEYMYGIGSGRGDRADAISWLEKRAHHLKDEMFMVEARLERMRHEHLLLKAHMQDLELLKKK